MVSGIVFLFERKREKKAELSRMAIRTDEKEEKEASNFLFKVGLGFELGSDEEAGGAEDSKTNSNKN